MTQEVHLGDIGTVFELTVTEKNVALDISLATELQILFKKPSGTVLTKTAVFTNTGSDGLIRYLSIEGDLDEVGSWFIQGRVTLPGGKWSTEKGSFLVESII